MPQDNERIQATAMDFDNAIESRDMDAIIEAFAEDYEVELLGITRSGKEGVRKWANWLFNSVPEIKFTPIIIMVDDGIFFEEFLVSGTLLDGQIVESKQSGVLVYEDYKIKSLRIYFDRLDFADFVATDFLSKRVVRMLKSRSLRRPVQ
ncbi:MAG: nuclear transport factor 2 family protein [Candidatus Thorarchaeota archaeon]|nr:nuclear transport factor 2 family protein [Candidatus Thorarchaeota archaeon]